jgi:hypothetical protein
MYVTMLHQAKYFYIDGVNCIRSNVEICNSDVYTHFMKAYGEQKRNFTDF